MSVPTGENSLQLIRAMSMTPDHRMTELFWELLSDEKITKEKAYALVEGLRQAYLGDRYYSISNIPASDRRALREDAKPRTESGPDLQRLAALTLLANVDADEAAAAAGRLANDQQLGSAPAARCLPSVSSYAAQEERRAGGNHGDGKR